MTRLLAFAIVVATALPAAAATRRFAVVIGHNVGAPRRPVLRYAESDAGRVARTLQEVGGVGPGDLWLVQGKGLAETTAALRLASQSIASAQSEPEVRTVLTVYFSGHSDGGGLELAGQYWPFSNLKRDVMASGADLKLLIIDACHSGAAINAKGGRLAPPVEVVLNEELLTTGMVTLASSAADELALESDEVRGSYFTHHLLSGLRGSADTSGDGRVSLAEAYRYAYDHTVVSSGDTTSGMHHPVFELEVAGQAEIVLSTIDGAGASLTTPEQAERTVIWDLVRDQVIAEVKKGGVRIIVPPGTLLVRATKGGKTYAGRVEVRPSEHRMVTMRDLTPTGPFRSDGEKGNTAKAVALAPVSSWVAKPSPPRPQRSLALPILLLVGSAAILAASISFDATSETSSNGQFDGADLMPVAGYGAAGCLALFGVLGLVQ